MPTRVRCHCHGRPGCRLCRGERFYEYQPGPRGWLPFRCPTCEGGGTAADGAAACVTCERAGVVDPANPPYDPGWRGVLRVGWKFLFGGG